MKEMDNMETTNNETNGIYLAGSEHQSSESINLTGCWFVNFGADLPDGSIEGSRILTLKGNFDPDTLMNMLEENIYDVIPERGKEMLNKHNKRIIIRAFNRI